MRTFLLSLTALLTVACDDVGTLQFDGLDTATVVDSDSTPDVVDTDEGAETDTLTGDTDDSDGGVETDETDEVDPIDPLAGRTVVIDLQNSHTTISVPRMPRGAETAWIVLGVVEDGFRECNGQDETGNDCYGTYGPSMTPAQVARFPVSVTIDSGVIGFGDDNSQLMFCGVWGDATLEGTSCDPDYTFTIATSIRDYRTP